MDGCLWQYASLIHVFQTGEWLFFDTVNLESLCHGSFRMGQLLCNAKCLYIMQPADPLAPCFILLPVK